MLEHLGFGESILLSLIGIALVFAVLIALSLFIRLMSVIIRAVEHTSPKKKEAPADTEAPVQMVQAKPSDTQNRVLGSAGDIRLYNVDDPTAAMVMAIVADELRLPLSELIFRSIREISEEEADQEISSHAHHSV